MAKDKTTTPVKAKCPITRAQFTKSAPRYLTVTVTDDKGQTLGSMTAPAREFSSGSVGYYAGDKLNIVIDGEACRLQSSINMAMVGSKELPK